MSYSRRARALFALAVNNWVSRAYLAVVALTGGYALYEELFLSRADASMAYVVPMLLTAPLNWVFTIALGWIPTDAPFYAGMAIGAVANAAVIGAVVRALSNRRPSITRPAPGA
ncbi:SCO4225 family membrane protein [Streptomyces sp. NPDC002643]